MASKKGIHDNDDMIIDEDEFEELEEQQGTGSAHIVTPGELITKDSAFMRGHGTFMKGSELYASVAGTVERVNKLISVKAAHPRYTGEIGDVVVGRITELGTKRWKVDIKARQDSVLLLSSIHLPGGVQRRKSESDERQMRSFFAEGDLLSAEIQAFFQDGAASLQTRNLKYGKLRNGMLVEIPSGLVRRSMSHFITLPCGVDVILGLNGYVWVSTHVPPLTQESAELDTMYSNENKDMTREERLAIVRVANCIKAIALEHEQVHETLIVYMYEASLEFSEYEILASGNRKKLLENAMSRIEL